MNTYQVKISDTKEFHRLSSIRPIITDTEIKGIYPKLQFVCCYIPLLDDEGDSPPKFLLSDNVLFDLVNERLIELNVDKEYQYYSDIELEDIEMKTIYMCTIKIKEEITCEELESYRMTMFKVPIERISNKED